MSDDLVTLFRESAPSAPASRVDLGTAVAQGRALRRRHRSRQAGVAAVTAGSLAAVALVATAGLAGRAAPTGIGAGDPSVTLPSATPGGSTPSALPTDGSVITSTSSPVPTPVVSSPNATPAATSAAATPAAVDLPSQASLVALARAVAAPAPGTASVQFRQDVPVDGSPGSPVASRGVTLLVTSPGRHYFNVSVDVEPVGLNTVARTASGCAAGAADGKPCTLIRSTPTMVTFSSRFTAPQKGRETLWLTAETHSGLLLTVIVDNYVEAPPNGLKVIGPSWKSVGITEKQLVAAVTASGLLG